MHIAGTMEIEFIVIYFSVSLLFMISVFVFLFRRKKNRAGNYEEYAHKLAEAIKTENISGIKKYGRLVIWNEKSTEDKTREILEISGSLKARYPEIETLWREAHYLVYGVYPE